jgi:DNA-binding beta-propeller fold protein YncE
MGRAARFRYPSGITIDKAGNLYVADRGNNAFRKIYTNGSVTTFVGTRTGFIDGQGTMAAYAELQLTQMIIYTLQTKITMQFGKFTRMALSSPL